MQSAGYDLDVHALAGVRADGTARTIFDICEPAELAICTIEHSVSMPMQEAATSVGTLPCGYPLGVVRHLGVRSTLMTYILRTNRFDNSWNLAGGFDV